MAISFVRDDVVFLIDISVEERCLLISISMASREVLRVGGPLCWVEAKQPCGNSAVEERVHVKSRYDQVVTARGSVSSLKLALVVRWAQIAVTGHSTQYESRQKQDS